MRESIAHALARVDWYLDLIQKQFTNYFNNELDDALKTFFCLDETLVPFLGCVEMRQYLPDKPHPFGLLVRVLTVAKQRFIVRFELYVGKLKAIQTALPELVKRMV